MNDVITALFDGIAQVLKQPAAAAIIASIVSIAGTLCVSRMSASDAARSAHREYLRRRHDRFEQAMAGLASVVDVWERAEVSLLLAYWSGELDAPREPANELRQQVANHVTQLRALAPRDESSSPGRELHLALNAVQRAREDCYSTRTGIEGAIEEERLDTMQDTVTHAPQTAYAVAIAIHELFEANATYVETRR